MFETIRAALTPPPLPPWEGLHVLVVHFPEALLVFAPVFVLMATVLPIRCRWASWAGLIVLVGGTAGACMAVMTGFAAQSVAADGSDAMYVVMSRHEELATMTRNVYLGITALYAVALFLPMFFKRLFVVRYLVPVNIVALLLLGIGDLFLANTGHLGGRLVHEFGVKAVMDKSKVAEADEKEAESEDAPDKGATAKTAAAKTVTAKKLPDKPSQEKK